ncbi:copper resistance protein B (plasmid) [Leisingera sp. S132]|uniref:copper resistance protein B n=1 Tax=Leisingera sp. S132 TaxID=2867016 RepID=UPI0017FDEDAC|nr:copper resistance protein B [Leisingera sp. S132]NVK14050.1 copper resistance protein B [Paracoccaceae bacterium]UWQ81714.1 copper resistance protein B [Leisingera sp. S132]
MSKTRNAAFAAAGAAALCSAPARAEQLIYGFQAEQLEYRQSDGEDAFVWDFDAMIGTDELKLVWRSEGERVQGSGELEALENQLRLQFPVSTFFDAVVGVQASTPDGLPDRYNAVLGLKGLAPQWFEIDADLYLSDNSFFRFEGEYEAALTNRLILTPNLELTVPLQDDPAYDQAAGGATVEAGLRLSYDLIDRAVSPYIGVNYEESFGGTADLLRASGEENGVFSVVFGTRLMF